MHWPGFDPCGSSIRSAAGADTTVTAGLVAEVYALLPCTPTDTVTDWFGSATPPVSRAVNTARCENAPCAPCAMSSTQVPFCTRAVTPGPEAQKAARSRSPNCRNSVAWKSSTTVRFRPAWMAKVTV